MAVTYVVRMRAFEGQEDAVQAILLENLQRIRAGESGNLAFAVHRSRSNPREFWLYETWADEKAVEAHESGEDFKSYKDRIRPLVEPDSLVFGDAEPLDAIGFP